MWREESDIPEHVWHDEESHMRAPYIHLVEMADSPVARRHSDILKLDVHVVFGCKCENGLALYLVQYVWWDRIPPITNLLGVCRGILDRR